MSDAPPDRTPLSDAELRRFVDAHPAWSLIHVPARSGGAAEGAALFRRYRFTSFSAVLDFMAAAVPFINERDHHPSWTNAYHDRRRGHRTLDVTLTTWDADGAVTPLDCSLAEHLDVLFATAGTGATD